MNADAITKQIMEEIGQKVYTDEVETVRYAIERAVGSIISGLTSTDQPQPDPSEKRQHEAWGWQRRDSFKNSTTTACCAGCPISKYEYRISELESLLRTRTKQVSIALAIRDLHRKFDRECQEHPL